MYSGEMFQVVFFPFALKLQEHILKLLRIYFMSNKFFRDII